MKLLAGHLSYEKLVAHAADGAVLAAREARHFAACRHCHRSVATISKMLRLMRAEKECSVAPETRRWAWQAFRANHATQRKASLTQKLVAVARAGVSPLQPAFGERSAMVGLAGEDWQRLYHAGAYDLDVRVETTGDKRAVSGQVLGPCNAGEVELTGPSVNLHTHLDSFASFFLPPVPHGAYTLWLRWPGTEIEVPDLIM